MALSYGAVGTASNGTTSLTPAYPTGISSTTSELVLVLTGRSNTANTAFSVPAGWTRRAVLEGGTGTWGVDTGTRRVEIWSKNTVTGSESGTITVTLAGTTANTARATIHRIVKAAGVTIDWASGTGADTTNGTGYSATTSSSVNLAANDFCLIGVAQNIDNGTLSSLSVSSSGITFGTLTSRASTAVTNGNDHRHILYSVPVNSGSGTNAVTFAYTISANGSGPMAFVRMREVFAPPSITDQPDNATVNEGDTANFSVTATGNITGYQWQVLQSSNTEGSSGTVLKTSAAANLDSPTTVDWALWGNSSLTPTQRKNGGGSTISAELFGPGTAIGYTGDPRTISWTNGTPTASGSSNDGTYNDSGVAFTGFAINFPATTTTRIARVYCGYFSADAVVTAIIVENEDLPVFLDDSTLTGTLSTSNNGYIEISYRGSAPGQTLQVIVALANDLGSGNVSIQAASWSELEWLDVTDGTGGTTSSYTTAATTLGMDGYQYRVNVTGPGGTTTSSTATLTVNPPPVPVITVQPVDATVTEGDTANFSLTATDATSYQWQRLIESSAEITGTVQTYALTNTSTPGAQTIDVPDDAEGVIMFWSQWEAVASTTLSSLTSNFADTFTIDQLEASVSGAGKVGVGVAYARITGTGVGLSFTPVWTGTTIGSGPTWMVAFVKGIPPTGDWIRWTDVNQDTSGSSAVDVIIVSETTDLVLAFDSNDGSGIPSNPTGWTSVQTQVGTAGTFDIASRLRKADTPGEPTTIATTQGTGGYATIAGISVISAGFTWIDVTEGTGATTNSYTTPATTIADYDGRTYRCLVSNTFGTVISGEADLTVIPASAGALIKYWTGSAWIEKPLKRWNGSSWVTTSVLKYYNGSTWV